MVVAAHMATTRANYAPRGSYRYANNSACVLQWLANPDRKLIEHASDLNRSEIAASDDLTAEVAGSDAGEYNLSSGHNANGHGLDARPQFVESIYRCRGPYADGSVELRCRPGRKAAQ